MRKSFGERLVGLCLVFLMAVSFIPVNVFAAESDLTEQEEQVQGIEDLDEGQSEGLVEYDMYRDGSGKNIESGEEVPASVDDGQDVIQSIGGMSLGKDGLEIIKAFELCRLKAYKPVDTEKYYTIGWGHYGPDVKKNMTITQERADKLLDQDVVKFVGYVNNFSKRNRVNLNQNQFDALVSFTYNVGTRWMNGSTLRTYLINGVGKYTNAQITNAFVMWNKAGGRVLAGLTRRRKEEAALFLKTTMSASEVPIISGQNAPSDMVKGSDFEIWGLVSSKTKLKKVSVGVYDEMGNCVVEKVAKPNSTRYALPNLNADIIFSKLSVGSYRYIVSAANAKGTANLVEKGFKIYEKHKHSYITKVTKAKPTANGKIVKECSKCGRVQTTTVIYAPKTMKLSMTSYTYTGKPKKPSVTVMDSNGDIVDSSHYTVSYEKGRIEVGTYKITAKFDSDKYEGSCSKTITINPASQKIVGTTNYTKNVSSKAFVLDTELTKGDGEISYISDNESVAIVSPTTGEVTIKGAGTATITVTASATERYKATDYKVVVKVNPLKVMLKSVTSPYAGKMLMKWYKNIKATGYQISYATNAGFLSDKKVNVEGDGILYKTVSGLVRGRKYYVRVRCYEVVNGVKYYSAYSDAESIIIKK